MLRSLTVSNFALIENVRIEFQPGLNIITGETGAGKSIVIDALACVLGDRTSAESIRTGQDFLRVEAVFDLTGNTAGLACLEEMAIPVEDESNVIIVRRITAAGKNTVIINGCQTTVGALKRLTQSLMDIHGQHDSQSLLRPEHYIRHLDQFSAAVMKALQQYRKSYQQWKTAETALREAMDKSQERERRLDMLAWQRDEIAAAKLKPGEETELENQIKVLANSEKIAKSVNHAYALFSGEADGGAGITDRLADAKKAVEQAARYDERLERQVTIIEDAICQLQDVEHDLQNYFQEMEFNPGRLSELQARMDVIYKLKRKYGQSTAEILAYYEMITAEIASLETIDQQIGQLKQGSAALEAKLKAESEALTALRRSAGNQLEQIITGHLKDLGMKGAQFIVELRELDHYSERGRDQVSFLFTANPGEEPRPLHKVASGGELSRIALAMKAVLATQEDSQSMVFDELDTGIGGKTAQMVAEKIAFVAQSKQIICITHLPQIAVMGDRHLHIEKITDGETTKAVVQTLDAAARQQEIARMISGDDQSEISQANAVRMLDDAKIKKDIWKKKAQA